MSGKQNGKHVIVLNGKHYDTKTGQLIHAPTQHTPKHPHIASSHPVKTTPAKQHTKPQTVAHPASAHAPKHRSIDGISRPTRAAATTAQPPKHNRSANHAARKPQRSHTVMRAAVKHPVITVAKPVADTPAQAIVTPAPSALGLDTERLERAKRIHQDQRISRFGVLAPLSSQEQPAHHPTAPADTAVTPPNIQAPVSPPSQPEQLSQFEQAIAAATSHTQPRPNHKTKRHHQIARKLRMKPSTLTAATAALLVIGLGGLLIRQNAPALQVQLAGTRAGVSSSLPSTIPSGYALANGVDYKEGEVKLTYQSQTNDDRAFTITQTESFWTSESLKENYLETLDSDYQAIQENGKTIYIYDNGATWVDGGVWYRVDAREAALSSTQLIDIINSL
jgi:hypothetical protein